MSTAVPALLAFLVSSFCGPAAAAPVHVPAGGMAVVSGGRVRVVPTPTGTVIVPVGGRPAIRAGGRTPDRGRAPRTGHAAPGGRR
ncbi:hypothetical protein [Methylomagnum sp.]